MLGRLLLLLLVGCADGRDADGDGSPASEDCDDGDAARHPGASEACDGVDADCDQLADDDDPDAPRTTFYADLDGDGFGRAAGTIEACEQPEGYVTDTTDCDDARAAVYPGATEACDGLDGDCDGLGDDADSDVPGVTWYLDADGDGFGDPATARVSCATPDEHVTDATDCDDGDVGVFPGAEDACGGGDADCDGFDDGCVLEGDVSLEAAAATLVGEDPGDGAGSALAIGDVDADGVADLLVGARDAAYLVHGPFAGERELRTSELRVLGGYPSLAVGDLDADGLDELVLGADGGVWTLREGTTGTVDAGAAAITGEGFYALAAGGDLDGDGAGDLVVGAPGAAAGDLDDAGAVYLYDGPTSTSGSGEALGVLRGTAIDGRFGYAVGFAGDLDGDGAADLVVGAPDDDTTDVAAGAVWVFRGPIAGEMTTADADVTLLGVAAGDRAGAAVAGVGDVNGDGVRDVMVGAPDETTVSVDSGVVYLLLGGAAEGPTLATSACTFVGVEGTSGVGATIGAVGDVNADGRADVLIGGSEADRVWLAQGPFMGTISLQYAEGALLQVAEGDRSGAALAGGADLDGDGGLDLVVGSPGADRGGSGAGVVSILRGWED